MNRNRKMRVILGTALLIVLVFVLNTVALAIAHNGQCGDNVFWSTDDSDTVMLIKGTGPMTDYPWETSFFFLYYFRQNIEHVDFISDDVTTIGDYAFQQKQEGVFKTINFPAKLQRIGQGAFYMCTGLKSLTFPNSLTSIGKSAFCECTGLEEVKLSSSLTEIGPWAFDSCIKLKAVEFPKGIKTIGSWAFYQCVSLKDITIPEGVETLSDSVFLKCFGLKSISLPSTLKEIGDDALSQCVALESITIPQGVESIGAAAFSGCKALTSVAVPDSVTETGRYTFGACTGLTSATLSKKMTYIPEEMFEGCTALESIVIPDGVETIGKDAFSGCSAMKSITIPKSMNYVPSPAFGDCTSLKDVYYQGTEAEAKKIICHNDNGYFLNATWHYLGEEITPPPAEDDTPAVNPEPVPADKVVAFVTRCYQVIQGRNPDAGGLEYWVTKLKAKTKTAAEIVYEFITSNEFKAKGYSARQVIEILYRSMQGRESDEGGMAYWLGKVQNGATYADLVNGFCTSNEFKSICATYDINPGSVKAAGDESRPAVNVDTTQVRAFLSRCYQLMQKREPDDGGLDYWTNAIIKGKTAAEVVYEFINSNEFRARHLSNREIAEILYLTALNRAPEEEGMTYWLNRFDRGDTMAAIVNGFCESNEFKKICAAYGITPGAVKASDNNVKGVSTAARTQTGTAKETRQMNEGKIKEFVFRAYTAALGREPGDAEAEYWVWQLKEMKIAPADAAKGILTSNEFKARGIGGEQLIRILYRVYANRDADEAGLSFWLEKLNAGTAPEEIMDGFAASSEFKNIVRSFWE